MRSGAGETRMIHNLVAAAEVRRADARLGEPQQRLTVAVLQTVWDDCRGSAHHRRRAGLGPHTNRRGARHATADGASTDRGWPFSVENICKTLGMDAGRLRRELHDDSG